VQKIWENGTSNWISKNLAVHAASYFGEDRHGFRNNRTCGLKPSKEAAPLPGTNPDVTHLYVIRTKTRGSCPITETPRRTETLPYCMSSLLLVLLTLPCSAMIFSPTHLGSSSHGIQSINVNVYYLIHCEPMEYNRSNPQKRQRFP